MAKQRVEELQKTNTNMKETKHFTRYNLHSWHFIKQWKRKNEILWVFKINKVAAVIINTITTRDARWMLFLFRGIFKKNKNGGESRTIVDECLLLSKADFYWKKPLIRIPMTTNSDRVVLARLYY